MSDIIFIATCQFIKFGMSLITKVESPLTFTANTRR